MFLGATLWCKTASSSDIGRFAETGGAVLGPGTAIPASQAGFAQLWPTQKPFKGLLEPFPIALKPFRIAQKPFLSGQKSFPIAQKSFRTAQKPIKEAQNPVRAIQKPFLRAQKSFRGAQKWFLNAQMSQSGPLGPFRGAQMSFPEARISFREARIPRRVPRRVVRFEIVPPLAVFGAWCIAARRAEDGGSGHRALCNDDDRAGSWLLKAATTAPGISVSPVAQACSWDRRLARLSPWSGFIRTGGTPMPPANRP